MISHNSAQGPDFSPLMNNTEIQQWIERDNTRCVDQSAKAIDVRRAMAWRAFDHANTIHHQRIKADRDKVLASLGEPFKSDQR